MKCINIAVGLLLLGIVSPAEAALISVRDTLGGATVVDGASITDFGAGNDWGTAASLAEPPFGSTFASATFRIGGLQPGLTFPFTSVSEFEPFSWTFFLGSELELSANPRLLDTGPMDHVFTEAEGLQLSIFGTFPDFYAEVSAFPGSDFLLPPDTRFALKAEAASASLGTVFLLAYDGPVDPLSEDLFAGSVEGTPFPLGGVISSYEQGFAQYGVRLDAHIVPEPSTAVLAIAGATALLLARRRRFT